jgi:peroxiredoxin Q/BCP
LSDFSDQWVVLYFYPKDDTPGCTVEAKDFTEFNQQFNQLKAKILGVSTDSGKSHCRFLNKHNLEITLLSLYRTSFSRTLWRLAIEEIYGQRIYGCSAVNFFNFTR